MGDRRLLVRATVNLQGCRLGEHVYIDPEAEWVRPYLANGMLTPVPGQEPPQPVVRESTPEAAEDTAEPGEPEEAPVTPSLEGQGDRLDGDSEDVLEAPVASEG